MRLLSILLLSLVTAIAGTPASAQGSSAASAASARADARGPQRAGERLEMYRIQIEVANTQWESFRETLEGLRSKGSISQTDYERMIGTYKKGLGQYRLAMASNKASLPPSGGNEAFVFVPDYRTLYASRAALAGARVELARFQTDQLAGYSKTAKAAALNAWTGSEFDPARSYVQDRFPVPLANESLASYAGRVEGFSGMMMNSSENPVADLLVTSKPSGARVTIAAKWGVTSRSRDTDAPFLNLVMGLYKVTVVLDGYVTYEGELNWIDDLQPKLVCDLTKTGQGAASVCRAGGQP